MTRDNWKCSMRCWGFQEIPSRPNHLVFQFRSLLTKPKNLKTVKKTLPRVQRRNETKNWIAKKWQGACIQAPIWAKRSPRKTYFWTSSSVILQGTKKKTKETRKQLSSQSKTDSHLPKEKGAMTQLQELSRDSSEWRTISSQKWTKSRNKWNKLHRFRA